MDPAIEPVPHRFRSSALLALDVQQFVKSTFPADFSNPKVRAFRMLEEALEMNQALGVTAEEATTLLGYVFNRDVGEVAQEYGGCVMTMIALGNSLGFDVTESGYAALNDARSRVDEIKVKATKKPQVA